jgi:hypothetical protein
MVSVDHSGMAAHLTRNDSRVLRSTVYPLQQTRLMICCGMAEMRMGMLGASVRKIKTLTVNTHTVTLIGKGRQNLTCFVF